MAYFVSTGCIPRDIMDSLPEAYGWAGSLKPLPKEYEAKREAEARRRQRKKLKKGLAKAKTRGV